MKVLFNAIESKENQHAIYSHFWGRSIWHTDMQNTKVLDCGLGSAKNLVILSRVLLGLSLLPLREEAYPPVLWTMMFILWYVLINYDDLDSASYSSILMNANFLSWFLNEVERHFRMSRGGRLLLDWNPKKYEVADHIATKVEVNP